MNSDDTATTCGKCIFRLMELKADPATPPRNISQFQIGNIIDGVCNRCGFQPQEHQPRRYRPGSFEMFKPIEDTFEPFPMQEAAAVDLSVIQYSSGTFAVCYPLQTPPEPIFSDNDIERIRAFLIGVSFKLYN